MKRLYFLTTILSILFIIPACDNDDGIIEPDYDATVTLLSQMTDPDVTVISDDSDVDSIHVDQVKMLFSRLKFSSTGNSDRTFKSEPMIFIAIDNEMPHLIDESMIPEGSYDRVKFELHRFSDSQLNEYSNNELYDDFTTEDRNSVIIEGKVFKDGEVTNFTHYGKITQNVVVEIETPINFDIDNESEVIIEVLPDIIFFDEGVLLDPTDINNFTAINNKIREAFKAYKSF